ncbi:hypothetical protein G4B88_007447, partial [Cannabis sativa]
MCPTTTTRWWYTSAFRWPEFDFSLSSSVFRWPEGFDLSYLTSGWSLESFRWFDLSIVDDLVWTFISLVESLALPNKLDDLIESTCKQTPNYNLCISSLQSDPRSSKATNVEGLGLVMVDVVKSKAQATLDRINQLLKQQKSSSTSTGTTTSTLKQALDHCALNYGAILNGDIPQATEAFTKGDFKFAQQGSDDAANEANLCENEFTPSGSSPITQMNKDVHDVALVTSSMAKIKRMKKNSISLLLFHITLFILLKSHYCYVLPLNEGNDLIEQTCKKTPHYDLCVSTLKSNPESSDSDLRGLAHIMVDTVLSKASDTLNFIRALLKQAPDENLEKSLAYCAELYIPVVKYSLPQVIDALTGGHFGFANYGISDAAKQAQACEKTFSGSDKSPLAEKNTLLHDLSE